MILATFINLINSDQFLIILQRNKVVKVVLIGTMIISSLITTKCSSRSETS